MPTSVGTYASRSAVEARIGGTFSAADEAMIDDACDQVNMTIERQTGRILAPIPSAVYLYDGDGTRRLYLPNTGDGTPTGGLRTPTLVEVAAYTGAGYATLASTQYFLRERAYSAGPYDALHFTDFPTGTYSSFPRGFATVRITAPAGPAAMPDDIIDLATATAVSAFQLRQAGSGQANEAYSQDDWVSRLFSPRDNGILRGYTLADRLF